MRLKNAPILYVGYILWLLCSASVPASYLVKLSACTLCVFCCSWVSMLLDCADCFCFDRYYITQCWNQGYHWQSGVLRTKAACSKMITMIHLMMRSRILADPPLHRQRTAVKWTNKREEKCQQTWIGVQHFSKVLTQMLHVGMLRKTFICIYGLRVKCVQLMFADDWGVWPFGCCR